MPLRKKPYRRSIGRRGRTVHASPSPLTQSGRAVLAEDPDSPGSLGIAISEAVEMAAQAEHTHYALGSVLNHVLLHQTVIGEEAIAQLAMVGDTPDVIVGCTGGGSNFGGLAFPFLREKLAGSPRHPLRGARGVPQPDQGRYRYDYGDTAGLAPMVRCTRWATTSSGPHPRRRAALPRHVAALSHVYELAWSRPRPRPDRVLRGRVRFARTEGIVPAPGRHTRSGGDPRGPALHRDGEAKVILTALCRSRPLRHGRYDAYFRGELADLDYPVNGSAPRWPACPSSPARSLGVVCAWMFDDD